MDFGKHLISGAGGAGARIGNRFDQPTGRRGLYAGEDEFAVLACRKRLRPVETRLDGTPRCLRLSSPHMVIEAPAAPLNVDHPASSPESHCGGVDGIAYMDARNVEARGSGPLPDRLRVGSQICRLCRLATAGQNGGGDNIASRAQPASPSLETKRQPAASSPCCETMPALLEPGVGNLR
ncbi:MAG TPA: hypothetical protein VGB79_10330 [Allosphingosinicella sp.]